MYLSADTLLHGGTYKIIRQISSGGFGITYEAEHVMLKKRVAIKEFFVKDFCNRDEETSHVTVGTQTKVALVKKLEKKFIGEAISISQLNHPNIVRVSDVFEENDTAYYVMDYIDGLSLADMVSRDGALPEQQAVKYILQVADALKYVHAQNRLHLDIKPGNIMVDSKDNAMLIDFGASKQYDEENGENTSTLLGKTPGYAPIEQMGNSVQHFTPATDIYSLGATLYKLITGQTPPEAVTLVSVSLPPMPSTITEGTRKAIETAMQIKKENRPQNIDEFLGILQSVHTDQSSKVEHSEEAIHDTEQEEDNLSLLEKAGRYAEAEDYVKALEIFHYLAKQGNAEAQCKLGLCYYNGYGVEEDLAEAVGWFRKAAEQGNADAQNLLGLCYDNGEGVDHNPIEAFKWYGKAAEQGLAVAQYNLGNCYADGNGVKKNVKKAAKWFQKAAEQGNADAQNLLGHCYDNGEGVWKNATEAVKWYRMAAEQGNDWGQYNLGISYYYGYGIYQDVSIAEYWLKRSADQGNEDAQKALDDIHNDNAETSKENSEHESYVKAPINNSRGMFTRLLSPNGRIRPLEYFLATLMMFGMICTFQIIDKMALLSVIGSGSAIGLKWVIGINFSILYILESIKRCHDYGESGWSFYHFRLNMSEDGNEGINKYGSQPTKSYHEQIENNSYYRGRVVFEETYEEEKRIRKRNNIIAAIVILLFFALIIFAVKYYSVEGVF